MPNIDHEKRARVTYQKLYGTVKPEQAWDDYEIQRRLTLLISYGRAVEREVWEQAAKEVEQIAVNHRSGFSPLLLEVQLARLKQCRAQGA